MTFTSWGFAQFNWHSFTQLPAWRLLLWLSLTWRQRYLIQKNFLSIPSLTWTLALHLFVQSEAFTVKRKKHANTHIHTPHHTHTHTHTHTQLPFCNTICSWLIWNCVKAVESCPFVFDFLADWCKTQELCDKVVSKDIFMLKYYTDRYKTQERCDNTVDSFLATLKFVPDRFFRNKVTKKLDGYS